MPKFFVNSEQITETEIIITGSDAHHINRVLRLKTGDEILVCDGKSYDYSCLITELSKNSVLLSITSKVFIDSEPEMKVTLFQGFPKSDKMELIIQKCVELGIYEIVPVFTEHTIVKASSINENKMLRLNKISETAAKQCGRGRIPKITNPVHFNEAIELMKSTENFDEAYFANEHEDTVNIAHCAKHSKGSSIAICIGPEGGFSFDEINTLKQNAISSMTLGSRILRTETAGFMALIIFLYERGLYNG